MNPQEQERKHATEKQLEQTKEMLDDVVMRLGRTTYGAHLLNKYPVRRTDKHTYPEVYAELRRAGSPAATDGKSVYVDVETLADMLVQDYPKLKRREGECYGTWEDYWKCDFDDSECDNLTDGTTIYSSAMNEIRDILLHEYTHALNEHVRQSATAEAHKATPEYMQKLSVAHEIQANDGLMGQQYATNILQRQKGVTNKRLHPETIGCHTINEIMSKLVLNEQEKRQAQARAAHANSSASVNKRVAQATGEYQRMVQEEKEKKGEDKDSPRQNGKEWTLNGDKTDTTSTETLTEELRTTGLAQVKQLLLEALSDNLRYDPTSDSVFFDEVTRRVAHRTYSRPSKRYAGGSMLLRKGVKYERIKEHNKANKLTILAVDASGSMHNQQSYVGALLDDLLQQAEQVAKEHKLEVHYERLLGLFHRTNASKIYQVASYEWREAMRQYRAGGGNTFDCVLHKVNGTLGQCDYDAVTIINLSDGLGVLGETEMPEHTRRYIDSNKLKWVDALILDTAYDVQRSADAVREDGIKIRTQVVLDVREKR